VHFNFKLLNEETGKRLDLDKSACRKIRVDFFHALKEKAMMFLQISNIVVSLKMR